MWFLDGICSQAHGMPNLIRFLDLALWRLGDNGYDIDYAHRWLRVVVGHELTVEGTKVLHCCSDHKLCNE